MVFGVSESDNSSWVTKQRRLEASPGKGRIHDIPTSIIIHGRAMATTGNPIHDEFRCQSAWTQSEDLAEETATQTVSPSTGTVHKPHRGNSLISLACNVFLLSLLGHRLEIVFTSLKTTFLRCWWDLSLHTAKEGSFKRITAVSKECYPFLYLGASS